MRLAAKFAMIFALLSIISISVMGYLVYQGGREMIINDKYSDLALANDYTQAAFERWVGENIRTLEMIAKRPFFTSKFNELITSHDPSDAAHMAKHHVMIEDHLMPVIEAGKFLEIFILRPDDGLVAFSTSKKQEEKQLDSQPFFTQGKKGSHVQNVYYSMSLQRAAMTIGTPIKNKKGELVAVLAGHVNLAELSNIMGQGKQVRETLDTYFVNKFNFFVTEPRFGKNYALKKSIHTQGVNAALSGKKGIGLYEDYRKIPVIGAYCWIPKWELGVISEIDQAKAFSPIFALRKAVIIVCAVIALLAALAGWLTTLTITRPLKRLMKDTEKIGKGNLDFTVRATGKNEVGELSRAFNRMIKELKETLVSRDTLAVAKEQMQREKEFSDKLINSLPGVFYLFDEKNLQFQRWNVNFEKVTGYSASEIAQISPLDLFDEQERVRVAQRIGQVFQKGYATVEANLLTKSGDRVPYFFTGYIQKIDDSTYLVGVGIDISERKLAEEALRKSEDRFRRLAENAKDVIYRMSLPEGRYEYVSPASLDVFRCSPEAFYENPAIVKQMIHPEWVNYFTEQWGRLLKGEIPPHFEYQIIDPSGHVKWLNQRNVLVTDNKGLPVAIEGIVTDVTDAKRIVQEQIRLEKFVLLGRLAAGVAHELNNPLMGVLNYAQYCIEETPKEDEKFSILQDIEHETRRCIDIVHNLLGASRLEESAFGKTTELDAQKILGRVIRLMEYRTGKENVKVFTKVTEDIPKIVMGSDALQQLLLNLFVNAVDAVETTEKKEIELQLQRDGNAIKFTVSDTGSGIPEDVRDKIFDPFFTTKEPGKGTGLGLATCWKIVHQQGGTIGFTSNPSSGTTITVVLPVHPSKTDFM